MGKKGLQPQTPECLSLHRRLPNDLRYRLMGNGGVIEVNVNISCSKAALWFDSAVRNANKYLKLLFLSPTEYLVSI